MKKLIAVLLALSLALALCACGGDTKKDEPAAKTDTDTVAVSAVVIARDDVPEDEIYGFVSAIFDNIDAIKEQHGKGAELDLAFASGVTSVPYHPGAAKYFAEKGYTVAATKDGAGVGDTKDLTFGTGGDAGTYYAFGSVLANFVSTKNDFSVTAVTSGGSKANVEDMTSGDVQLGFVQSDVMSYAYHGERLFDTKVDGFSVVAALYMEQVQIVTTSSAITSVADLNESDIKPVYQSFGDSADSLKDGKIDAAFIVAGAPTKAITYLATSGNVYLVSIDKEHSDKLLAESPFYSTYTIPADTY